MEWDEEKFIARLEQARVEKGLSQKALADALGLSAGTVSRWSRVKDNKPGYGEMLAIAHELGVTTNWLVFGVEPRTVDAADKATEFGSLLERYPELLRIFTAYVAAPPEGKRALEYWASGSIHGAQTPANKLPHFTSIQRDQFGKVYTPPPETPETKAGRDVASEPTANYGNEPMTTALNIRPIVDDPVMVDRRDELARFKVSRRAGRYPIKLPKWFDLAAGPGREIQRCTDYMYFRELPDWKNHHSAEIRGDSMLKTLRPRDIVILKLLNNSDGIALEPLDSEDMKGPMQRLQTYVPHGAICVLRINDDEPTLKRVHYFAGLTPKDWKLTIVADNPNAWEARPIGLKDRVVFYARAVGLAEE